MNTETTRRGLVGGVGLATVALAIPAVAALPTGFADRTAWRLASAKYSAAKAVIDGLVNSPDACPDEQMSAATATAYIAMFELFATPSPTVVGLAFKIELLAADLEDFEPDSDLIALVVTDAQRLAKQEA